MNTLTVLAPLAVLGAGAIAAAWTLTPDLAPRRRAQLAGTSFHSQTIDPKTRPWTTWTTWWEQLATGAGLNPKLARNLHWLTLGALMVTIPATTLIPGIGPPVAGPLIGITVCAFTITALNKKRDTRQHVFYQDMHRFTSGINSRIDAGLPAANAFENAYHDLPPGQLANEMAYYIDRTHNGNTPIAVALEELHNTTTSTDLKTLCKALTVASESGDYMGAALSTIKKYMHTRSQTSILRIQKTATDRQTMSLLLIAVPVTYLGTSYGGVLVMGTNPWANSLIMHALLIAITAGWAAIVVNYFKKLSALESL